MIRRTDAAGWLVEARAGSLARVEGATEPADGSQIAMSEWKKIIAEAVAANPMVPIRLVYGGGANLITGYRLYYMLQCAKGAGVRDLTLYTDGAFWIDEATDWLIESQVDTVVVCVPEGRPSETLARRVRELASRTAGAAGAPRVHVRASVPGVTGLPLS